jgi:hypothetical protein
MLNKLVFSYDKKENNLKKKLILNELKLKNTTKLNDTYSLTNTLNLKNKVNDEKLNQFKNFTESNEITGIIEENTNIELINIVNRTYNKIDLTLEEPSVNSRQTLIHDFTIELNTTRKYNKIDLDLEKHIYNKVQYTINDYTLDTIKLNLLKQLKKDGITTLTNIYQSTYKDNIKGTGLGDFIRGSYFLIYFCKKFQFNCKITFNNYISNCLKPTDILTYSEEEFNNILIFGNNNITESLISVENIVLEPIKDLNILNSFVEYLKKSKYYKNDMLIYCTSHPINEITEDDTQIMRNILEPINDIKIKVNNVLKNLSLKHKNYITLHIRSGDNYLNDTLNTTFKKRYITMLIEQIKQLIIPSEEYLLISDNNHIKSILLKSFPKIKTVFREIIHLGESTTAVINREKVQNTLIDFYLLSFSKKIDAFSCYKHGSGFSYWCAKTFNIVYSCKYIPIE